MCFLAAGSAAAAMALTGCGDGGPGTENLSKADVYKANVGAQCNDASELRNGLSFPDVGDSTDLANYLQQVIKIQQQHRQAINSIKPPPGLESLRTRGLKLDDQLTETLSSYMRAARGGRPFNTVVRQLQSELNPQIKKANAFFTANGVDDCQQKTLDFQF